MTDHGHFVLINCYFPMAQSDDLPRMQFKIDFYRAMQLRCESMVKSGRHVILVGDMNTCHTPLDHADFTSPINNKSAPSTRSTSIDKQDGDESKEDEPRPFEEHPARKWMHQFLVEGGGMFVDVFRVFHPNRPQAYTCWNTKVSRQENPSVSRNCLY